MFVTSYFFEVTPLLSQIPLIVTLFWDRSSLLPGIEGRGVHILDLTNNPLVKQLDLIPTTATLVLFTNQWNPIEWKPRGVHLGKLHHSIFWDLKKVVRSWTEGGHLRRQSPFWKMDGSNDTKCPSQLSINFAYAPYMQISFSTSTTLPDLVVLDARTLACLGMNNATRHTMPP